MPDIRDLLQPPPSPKPIFFTHSTGKEGYRGIMEVGRILPIKEIVPCSLDNGIINPWGVYKFIFPMSELVGKKVEPVFYLGTGDNMETEEGPGFLIMDMVCIFATEVRIYGELDISKARLVRNIPSPPTALVAFLSLIFPELKAHARFSLGLGAGITSYTLTCLLVVDAYNKMLASLFSIDYDEVKRVASASDIWEMRWWE